MSEPRQPGNQSLPDFNELNDRIIAKRRTTGPMLEIKTNLDPKDSTIDNPYLQNKNNTDLKTFRAFFEE
ncbi:hypothetical protein ACFFHH_07010 [Cytobacillus solani]|uniref:hypothetical protein n=1 Tax=Cytobacillus solani TaxID=1637975 RepID=UPI0006AB77C6|nr:hypothetical protein [Cytobacillus solani]KOP83013.1 hypothetical protein AMS60_11355 [Bacillus sp. FJAT-21945]